MDRLAPTTATSVALLLLGACGTSTGSSADDGVDCTSHYEPVASATTYAGLRRELLAYDKQGPVASLRTQPRHGKADTGPGDVYVTFAVDLLDRQGGRLLQVDVWRTEAGGWKAGAWSQCTD